MESTCDERTEATGVIMADRVCVAHDWVRAQVRTAPRPPRHPLHRTINPRATLLARSLPAKHRATVPLGHVLSSATP
jgi:hypothetical protein